MKKIMISLFLICDLAIAMAQFGTVLYNIPSAGQTVTIPSQYLNSSFIALGTDGAVNLGANSYTLTYSSLPPNGYTWEVKMDFRRLTISTNGSNVTIFGVKPLQAHPTVDTFDITYVVIPDSVGTKYLYYRYNGLNDGGVFNATTAFNGRVNFNDTVKLYGSTYLAPVSPISAGNVVVASDAAGKLTYGCAPWCITGNSGLSPTANFLGTTDTGSLRFRVNNVASGIIDYNLLNTSLGYQSNKGNTSGTGNASIGAYSLLTNTTGGSNTALGSASAYANTTGQYNTACGSSSLLANTTGSNNTAIGASALISNTTGQYNTACGEISCQTLTTGSYNTMIGAASHTATSSTTKAIGLGYDATPSSNQLAIAGIRSISIPQMTSAVRYVLTDTSGTGDFIPQPYPQNAQTTFTPLTGDSVTVTTSANLINPAGTIANFTLRLPASPYSGQLLEFSTTQIITTLHWSTALSSDVYLVDSHVPTTLSAGGVIKIMFNSATSKWYNY